MVPQEKLHREVAQRHQEVAAFVDGILLQTKSSTLDGPGHQSPVVKPSIHSGCSMNRILILYHFGTLNLPPFVQILLPFPFVNSSSFWPTYARYLCSRSSTKRSRTTSCCDALWQSSRDASNHSDSSSGTGVKSTCPFLVRDNNSKIFDFKFKKFRSLGIPGSPSGYL